jgi:hypothetical protein
MATPDFAAMFNTIKSGVTSLAQSSLKTFTEQAKGEVQTLLTSVQSNIKTWTLEYTSGKMDKDELADLIGGQAAVIQEATLMEAGLAQIQIDQLKAGIINLVVDTVTKAL